MSGVNGLQRAVLWALGLLERYRFIKFGIVGASGVVVNLTVLHLGHEYLFNAIEAGYKKPYLSLALAIALATLNNFTWNRLWTWSDRQHATAVEEGQRLRKRSLLAQLGQYATASWLGILLQYALTLWLTHLGLHYLIANVTAIVIASVSNFIANDRWTFRHARKP